MWLIRKGLLRGRETARGVASVGRMTHRVMRWMNGDKLLASNNSISLSKFFEIFGWLDGLKPTPAAHVKLCDSHCTFLKVTFPVDIIAQ